MGWSKPSRLVVQYLVLWIMGWSKPSRLVPGLYYTNNTVQYLD